MADHGTSSVAVRVRFAPSPTGYMHLGNARMALVNWLLAQQRGGHYLLRIDDTDGERSEERYVAALREDLAWLGIDPDAETRQSQRSEHYDAAAARLREGGFLYPCYESAEELAAKRARARRAGAPPIYDRAALSMTDGERRAHEQDGRRPHWRFLLSGETRRWQDLVRGEQGVDTGSVSDPILIRGDGSYLYTLPSLVDDMECGITHILRGEDHVTNSGVQIEIFAALGSALPVMGHFPLLTGPGGEPLSKRLGAVSLRGLREEGIEPEAICSVLARVGTSRPVTSEAHMSMISDFDPGSFGRAAAVLDMAQLRAISVDLVRDTGYQTARKRLGAHRHVDRFSEHFWRSIASNVARFADIGDWLELVHGPPPNLSMDDDTRSFLRLAAECLPESVAGDSDIWPLWTERLRNATDRRGKTMFMPLRTALTGREHGPDMKSVVALMGLQRVRERIRLAAKSA